MVLSVYPLIAVFIQIEAAVVHAHMTRRFYQRDKPVVCTDYELPWRVDRDWAPT